MLGGSPAFSGMSAPDIAAERDFYADVLGLAVTEVNGMLNVTLANGGRFIVYPKPDHVPAAFTVLNFPVDDIEAAVPALEARGVRFEPYDWNDGEAIMRKGGPLIAWFTDPAGNVLSVLQED